MRCVYCNKEFNCDETINKVAKRYHLKYEKMYPDKNVCTGCAMNDLAYLDEKYEDYAHSCNYFGIILPKQPLHYGIEAKNEEMS